ncbi:hypothetical protein DFJ74DRAFT_343095 [Hyaloraphidium curvatum]|nr:hypothetical protein DFJ74DRAFT_343095 [Hyaloraphidium curvatum]
MFGTAVNSLHSLSLLCSKVAFGVRVINFFNDNLEATRSVSVPINSADKVAIKELRTRIDGGSPRGGAEAKAALSKLVNLTNAADLAGFTDALADNAIWIAPWFKVCRGKEACMALAKSVFEGGLKSVKMLGEPDSFTPFTAVVGTEWMNEGLFPVKTTQSLYMVSLEPPSGKIARVANYPEDLKDVETMRMQYNKDYANAAESA